MANQRTPEPPSPSTLRIPNAPKYGPIYDTYEPYAPRKSARVAQRAQRAEGTPPPPQRSEKSQDYLMASPPATVKTYRFTATTDLASPPPTIKAASRRKAIPGYDLTSRANLEDQAYNKNDAAVIAGTESVLHNGMLPTPAKTPTSKKSAIETSSISAVARNLFPYSHPVTIDGIMPSPKKKGRKKLNGFEITSDVEEEAPIEIYTDSKERIPEIDDTEDNPFYDDNNTTSKPKQISRTTKRRKVEGASEAEHIYGSETMGTNGAVFTFRGKKIWRSFEKKNNYGTDADAQLEEELDALVPAHLTLPIKSDPLKKGTWLFGEHPRKSQADEDEEATTDVEEKAHKKAGQNIKYTPGKASASTKGRVVNSITTRVTRAQKLALGHDSAGEGDDELTLRGGARGRGQSRAGNTTPFDHWSRTRSPMEDPSSLGSPTRKSRLRGPATRSRGEAGTTHV